MDVETSGIKVEQLDENEDCIVSSKQYGRTTRNSRKSVDVDYSVDSDPDSVDDSDPEYNVGRKRKKNNSSKSVSSKSRTYARSIFVTNKTPMSSNTEFAIRCTKCSQKFLTLNRMLNHVRGYHEGTLVSFIRV